MVGPKYHISICMFMYYFAQMPNYHGLKYVPILPNLYIGVLAPSTQNVELWSSCICQVQKNSLRWMLVHYDQQTTNRADLGKVSTKEEMP